MIDLLRRNRDLRLVFLAQVVSFLGDWFADVALLGLMLELTGSPIWASLILVSTMLPVFLVTPLAGPMVDAFDRRKLIMAVSGGQAVAALLLLGVGESTVWLALVARALIAGLSAFVGPAVQASVPNLVEPEDLTRANILLGSVWGAMLAVGAAAGGAFTVVFGRSASFVADALTFVVAACLIALVRRPLRAPRPGDTAAPARRVRPLADSKEAFHYASANRPLTLLLCSKAGLGLAGGVVPLLAVFGKEVFDGGDAGIGLLLGARGVGALIGPMVGQRWLTRSGTVATAASVPAILLLCGTGAVVYGVGYAAVAAAPSLPLAMVAVFLAHLGGGAQWALSNLGLQVATDDALRGRIFAADFAILTLTMSTSYLAGGWAAGRFGPRPVTLVLAVIAGSWGALYLSVTRGLRRAEVAETPLPP